MAATESFAEIETRMQKAGYGTAAIRAFQHSYDTIAAGKTGLLPESAIQPVTELPRYEDLSASAPDPALLAQTAVIKLNGGLGTGMGLDQAKSLLVLKDGLTFLDFIARQILHLRRQYNFPLRFLLMNSFSTSKGTLDFLKKYPGLGDPAQLEFLQSAVPKLDAQTLRPVAWPQNPALEWCPPGHGDLYPSLLGSGQLDRLLAAGVKYLFVSNSDNLGACLDLKLLGYFAASDRSFMMEVCERAAADRKGGHIAWNGSRYLLRETAQCPPEDEAAFGDIHRHRYFNTNNLWMRLDRIKQLLDANGGFIPLPIIKNVKTVDPRDKKSTKVFQLETAMGTAIECFPDSGAVIVPRARFAPVKTTADLLGLRSDAFRVTEDWRLVLAEACRNVPPVIDLDGDHYKFVNQLDAALTDGVPSLARCRELMVRGPVQFNSANIFTGKVSITNQSPQPFALPPGEYRDAELQEG